MWTLIREREGDRGRPKSRQNVILGLSIMTLIYVGVIFTTHGLNVADAPLYSRDISDWAGGVREGQLWEFDHVLWRPLGYSALRTLWTGSPAAPEALRRIVTRKVLDDISLVCGGLSVLLFWLLARDVARSPKIGYAVATGFLCFEAFLNFAHAGTSYMPGLLLSTLGLWLVRRSPGGERKWAWMGGIASGAAALMWVPYVLSIPAVLLESWFRLLPQRRREFLIQTIIAATFTVSAGYALAESARGMHTVADFRAWIQNGVHAKQTKNLVT